MTRTKRAARAARDQAKREGRIWLWLLPVFAGIWLFSLSAETRIWPVITEATIISAAPAGDGWTRLGVEAEKLRVCDWRSVEWFLGRRGTGGPKVQAYFADKPEIRGLGILRWDGLMVRLPEDVIRTHSYGDVLHECYGPSFGETRSRYFTGK